jgi:hypothetical protein
MIDENKGLILKMIVKSVNIFKINYKSIQQQKKIQIIKKKLILSHWSLILFKNANKLNLLSNTTW